MHLEAVIGVDVGSTEIKALVVDPDGAVLSSRRRSTSWERDGEGRCELAANLLLDRVVETVSEAVLIVERSSRQPVRVVSIAVTGMAESGVLVDRGGAALHPIIAWFDQRGESGLAAVPGALRAEFSSRTGLPWSPLCSFAKLNWLVTQGFPVERASRWLNVPEYIAHALGGAAVTEPSLASRTGLLDQSTRTAWSPALEYLGLRPELLPSLTAAGTPTGTVTHSGMPEAVRGAVVTVAGHDHPVASVASGVWHDEHLFDSCGTSEALLRVVSAPLRDDQRRRLTDHRLAQGMHVLPDRWILLGGTRGGLLLDRVLTLLGRKEQEARTELDRLWSSGVDDVGDVLVSGAHASSERVTVEITGDEATPLHVWSAALRHAMTETDAVLDVMRAEVGPHEHVTAAGGWTRLSSFRAAKENNLPGVRYSRIEQPSGYGAAIFAMHAAWPEVSTVDIARRFTTGLARATRGDSQ